MEAQLRRLWPRRKSVKKATKPEVTAVPQLPIIRPAFAYNDSYEATVSGPPPEVGALPLKPSNDTRPRKSFSHSKAQSAGLQQFHTVIDKDVHSRANSTGGIQPILVGISRPATAGSMQKDVMEAGNMSLRTASISSNSRLHPVASLPEPRKAQKFQTTPRRHVDIMSFAAAAGKPHEGYNEEVAARNLNLKALAQESTTTIYVPRSKYQEDVAARNAASMGYRYKATIPMQSLPEGRQSDSLQRAASASTAPQAYKHEGAAVPPKLRSMQDSAAYHSRSGSATSKSSNPLPAIPQELSIEEVERAIPGLANRKRLEIGQLADESAKPETTFTRYPSMHSKHVPSNVRQATTVPKVPKLTTRANESRPIANGNPREHTNPLYSNPYEAPFADRPGSADRGSEMKKEQMLTHQAASKSSKYQNEEASQRIGNSSSRASSADRGRPPSLLSHRKDMSDRTFMDLTEDEPEKLSHHESPNTEYVESPIIAQATADMLQVHRAQVVSSNNNHPQVVRTTSDTKHHATSSARSLPAPSWQSKRWSGTFSDPGSFHTEQPLAFSAITTVSSMSPASRSISQFSPTAESWRTTRSGQRTSQSLTSRRAPFSDIARPRAADGDVEQSQIMARLPESQDNTRASAFHADTPPKPDAEQRNGLAAQTPQVLYTSPESLSSGDFIDPSRAFGVMTRDFATTPSRQSTTRPRAVEQKSRASILRRQNRPEAPRHNSEPAITREQKSNPRRHLGFEHKSNGVLDNIHELPVTSEPSASPQLDHVDTPVKELKASSFDEIEFARKQAQARAALLRLQMSLEEQYDMQPGRPDSSTQRHVARQILEQTQKPQPEEKKASVPPTSMYYEKKDYQSKAKTNRPAPIRTPSETTIKSGSSYSYEKAEPTSFSQSVYSTVTIAPATRSTTNSRTSSFTTGSASHSYNYASGANFNSANRTASALPNPPLTPVLPSPSGTEVSLSSFPMPTTAPQSPEHRGRQSTAEPERPRTARMHSTKSSVASIASVYSIPHHMVPSRDSSRRDQLDEEVKAW